VSYGLATCVLHDRMPNVPKVSELKLDLCIKVALHDGQSKTGFS